MGVDRPRRGYASSSKPRMAATTDQGEAKVGTVAVTSNFQEANPKGSDDIWEQVPEEERARFQKEKEFRRNLHRRCLQKAAADVESRKRLLQRGELDNLQSSVRPVIWGSALYRGLWAKAAKIKEPGS
ncbi:hypothetical protein M758_8G190600 [Ceratodon purpureus]|uniref:Uncharacterized protein n=1 Tax=Ceratodon purpureus TaxID=3225 RepID=A0A8T0H528_CERPU|nr:hypothetical protein KC19_8G195600 [Ceratodon purpureus]KAG0609515.1 hypothetical protein M758_8G190600 [Ceratodon purpureus]